MTNFAVFNLTRGDSNYEAYDVQNGWLCDFLIAGSNVMFFSNQLIGYVEGVATSGQFVLDFLGEGFDLLA